MKLQDLVFIFLIIIIPIILIFSYYLNLQADTIKIQIDYDRKLVEATKEAVQAFEINTTEWGSEYNTLANVKRRELLASINTFISGLSNKLGIGRTAKENILNYIPAIVYTLYDGYYIYSPTYVPKTITDNEGLQIFYYPQAVDEGMKFSTSGTQSIKGVTYAGKPIYQAKSGSEGTYEYNDENTIKTITFTYTLDRNNAIKEYKHVLKTFAPYTKAIENYTINYTLDNYVRIFGKNGESVETKEGYIIENYESIVIPEYSINGIKYNNISILPEVLTENIIIKEENELIPKKYEYIYNSNADKRYYDGENFFVIDFNHNKRILKGVDANSSLAEFKKIVVRVNDNDYLNLYQLLNPYKPEDEGLYVYNTLEKKYKKYKNNIEGLPYLKYDCSAINFFVENYYFNKWIKNHEILKNVDILSGKKQAIIDNINENLNLSIANYSANSKTEYKLPDLTENDWELALSNISMITFLQGIKTGLKTYNNYAIVASTENSEYINNNSLYYVFKEEENNNKDEYYHRYPCTNYIGEIEQGYRNIEFKLKNYDEGAYYKHTSYVKNEDNEFIPTYGIRACFNCIVNRNKNNLEGFDNSNWTRIHETTLARERYVQMSRTRLVELTHKCLHINIEYIPIEGQDEGHIKRCLDCGEETIYDTCYYYNKYKSNVNTHWFECNHCKRKIKEEPHTYNSIGLCVCGQYD